MSKIVNFTRRFDKNMQACFIGKGQQARLREHIDIIKENPLIGETKQGYLKKKKVRVYKFTFDKKHYLLAYVFFADKELIICLDIGVHENFYDRLEDYLKGINL